MRIAETREFLGKAFKARKRVLQVGKPGVGKTHITAEAARDFGAELIVSCLPLDDPSTIRGYPFRPVTAGANAEHCLFDTVARAFNAKVPTIWFLDDIGQASESVLKAIMRIVQFGELDGKKLPEYVTICGATNDVGHGAGVYGMIEPLKSRFHTIIDVETHVDDVVPYGLSKGWPSWLCAFLRNSPDALNDWKPSKSMKVDGACPRGWEYLAEWDNLGIEDQEVWAGCVGKGRATAALAFKELINELPDIDACLLDPDSAPVPENPSAQVLVSMAVASKMTAGNFGQCVKYLNRLKQMLRAYSIRDAFRAENQRRKDGKLDKNYRPLSSSRDFTAWATSSDGKDIMSANDSR